MFHVIVDNYFPGKQSYQPGEKSSENGNDHFEGQNPQEQLVETSEGNHQT